MCVYICVCVCVYVSLSLQMVQGYGLTETCAASVIASADVWAHNGTNGPPTPCTELR